MFTAYILLPIPVNNGFQKWDAHDLLDWECRSIPSSALIRWPFRGAWATHPPLCPQYRLRQNPGMTGSFTGRKRGDRTEASSAEVRRQTDWRHRHRQLCFTPENIDFLAVVERWLHGIMRRYRVTTIETGMGRKRHYIVGLGAFLFSIYAACLRLPIYAFTSVIKTCHATRWRLDARIPFRWCLFRPIPVWIVVFLASHYPAWFGFNGTLSLSTISLYCFRYNMQINNNDIHKRNK